MSTPSDVHTSFVTKCLSVITNGEHLLPLFLQAGINSRSKLVAAGADDASLLGLHELLTRQGKVGMVNWAQSMPTPAVGMRQLRIMIEEAQMLRHAESQAMGALVSLPLGTGAGVAMGAAAGATGVAATVPSADDQALRTAAVGLYDTAETVFNTKFEADARVKYLLVGKTAKGIRDNSHASFGLGEFALNISTTSGKGDTYTVFGQTWVSQDGQAKTVSVTTPADLFRQMERRVQVDAVTGAFDVIEHAKTKGVAPPTGADIMPESTVLYVKHNAATGALTAHKMVCYATIAGQTVQVEAMKRFCEQHPHVPISMCVGVIDAGVQRAIANLKMRGATADAAVHIACKKSPELYSLSLVTGAVPDDPAKKQRTESTSEEQLLAVAHTFEIDATEMPLMLELFGAEVVLSFDLICNAVQILADMLNVKAFPYEPATNDAAATRLEMMLEVASEKGLLGGLAAAPKSKPRTTLKWLEKAAISKGTE